MENSITNSKINQALNLLNMGNRKVNIFRSSSSEGVKHSNKKKEIFDKLRLTDHDIVTEAIFKSGGRADIFDLCCFRIYEVVNTESKESIERKKLTYPVGLDIQVIKA